MNKWLFLCVLLPAVCFGQNFASGHYRTKKDFVGFGIEFYSETTFKYSFWSCMSQRFGYGKYTITNDSLLLHFGQSYQCEEVETLHTADDADSVALRFLIVSAREMHLTSCKLELVDSSGKTLLSQSLDCYPDYNSSNDCPLYDIPFKRSSDSLTFRVTCENHQPVNFSIAPNSNQKIKVTLWHYYFPPIPYGTVMRYKIVSLKPDAIILRQNEYDIELTKIE